MNTLLHFRPTFVAALLALFAVDPGALSPAKPNRNRLEERLKETLANNPRADTNGDGTLSMEEHKAFMDKRRREREAKLAEMARKQPRLDTDGDGVLSLEEWRVVTERRREQREQQEARRAAWREAHPPSKADVAYGSHPRQVLDLWQASGEGPRPLVVFIHGGGWLAGDKGRVAPENVERFLEAGVSIASISYRYSNIAPFPAPMRDAGLAVQFLRAHAEELDLDKGRVACFGGSAGAVSSLWLAFHDDMAEPNAKDPVLRESTRLTCAGATNAPTTVDKRIMDEWFGMKVVAHKALYPFFGLKEESEEALYSEDVRRQAAEASPVNHLTKDDPPVFLDYRGRETPLTPDHTQGEVVHHALLGKKLKERADAIGVKAILHTNEPEYARDSDMVDFLIEQLR